MGDTNLLHVGRLAIYARGCVLGILYRPTHIFTAFRLCRSSIVGRLASASATAVPTVWKHPTTTCLPTLCTRLSTLSALALLACVHTEDA
jgi:hypothetical protein